MKKNNFMRRMAQCSAMLSLVLLLLSPAYAQQTSREKLLMDFGWKFHLGNEWGTGENPVNLGVSTGPARPDFDDSSWATVNLPHDWALALPFDRNAPADHGFKPIGPKFPENSVGWYRRTFTLSAEDFGKRIWIEFGGVYRDSRVYVNGCLVGRQPRGYSSFRYDITDVANYGGKNTISVRVDASQFEGWFYEGAGIYRHVWLEKTAPLAVAPDGIVVYSQFKNNVPQGPAEINIETLLDNFQTNAADAEVVYEILDPAGRNVAATRATATAQSGSRELKATTYVASPILWSPETPRLYKLVTTIRSAGRIVDRIETEFGIRTLAFDPDKGFLLNGKPYVIKGTADHQDHAGVGVALPDALQYFRVRTLKEMGANAIRTAHNEPTEELLEACDRLGMLVLDESRTFASDAQDLELLENQIRRDRNHASVFLWSIGNEEPLQATPVAARVARSMQTIVHQLDPSRRVTFAECCVGNEFVGINTVIDVRGWNYHLGRSMDEYHAAHPKQPNIGTETASILTTRGIYAIDQARGYQSAYDDAANLPRDDTSTAETWWKFYTARPWLSGGFAWTGFDYRGENDWPDAVSNYGIVDIAGFPKDDYYYYQSWWSQKPVLHLLPHWNWPGKDGQNIDVRCFSNLDEVELFLNGVSLGRKTMPRNSHLQWMVPYSSGTLLARGYKDGKFQAEEKIETTGAPAAIKLTPDRTTINPDGEDVSIITVAVIDAQGRVVPVADNLVNFEITGPGKLIGVGNGDPSSHEPDVYLNYTNDREIALNDWHMIGVADAKGRPEVAKAFADSDWQRVDVEAESGPLRENTSAVYRTHFNVGPEDLAAGDITLRFGMIDDDGSVYVNGHPIGESHDWRSSPTFDIRKFVHAGDNSIAVAVHNGDGSGGINKGVSLSVPTKTVPAKWARSVFNGLAQVIVQSGTTPGEIRLTAHAEGLMGNTVAIEANGHPPPPQALP